MPAFEYDPKWEEIKTKLKTLKERDLENALTLNEEFDRLKQELEDKEEAFKKAQKEMDDFKDRLNS